MKYTTVGDTVNVAARLEAFDRTAFAAADQGGGCRILISDETQRLVAAEIHAKPIGSLALKGRSGTTAAFLVVGHARGLQGVVL